LAEDIRHLRKGEILFSRGDPADGMYVLKKGRLEIYLENHDAKLGLALISPGGVVGEVSLLDHKPRSASVMATMDCELLFINNSKFMKALDECPKWFVNFVTMICSRLRNMNKRLQEMQDKHLFSLNQLKNWTEMLHATELILQRNGQTVEDMLAVDRYRLEAELQDIFCLELRKVSDFVDILAEQQVLLVHLSADHNVLVCLDNPQKMGLLLQFLHSSHPEEQSCFCDLIQFGRLLHYFRVTPKEALFSKILSVADAAEELSQASLEPRQGECRRRHFRILYKSGEHPVFETFKQRFKVIDISEQGVRFTKGQHDLFQTESEIIGILHFPSDRDKIEVKGRIVRVTEHDVAIELAAAGRIPLQRIMMEQRLLIQRGHMQSHGDLKKPA
jgi:CRP-like cAMP-binding protein